MSTDEYVTALKQYGAAIIAGSKPNTIDIPVFDLEPNDQLSLFDYVREQNDKELKIGFSYSLNRQLEKNYPKYDENVQSQIKNLLLSYAQTIKDESELNGILAAINLISTICDGNWSELISFLFSESKSSAEDELRGHILNSMSILRDEKFIKKHSDQLLALIHKLLKSNLPNRTKSMFLSILALCHQGSIMVKLLKEEDKKEDRIEQVDMDDGLFNDVWKVAVEIASTPNYRSVYPALQQLCLNVKDFKNRVSDSVDQIVKTFSDSSSDLESRLTTIIPLLRLLPFLNDRLILEVIIPASLECLTIDYFSSMMIINYINETDIELFENDFIISLWEILLQEIKGENNDRRNVAIALFAPFADQINNTVDDSLDEITQAIINSLNQIKESEWNQEQARFSALVAVTSLRSIIPRFESPNRELFQSLLPHITTTKDETLLIESNKTMRELLETGHYSTEDYEKEFIELYPKFKETRIEYFTKLIKELINADEEPGLSLAQPIYDFALPFLNIENPIDENALALEIFALLSQISTDFVEDQVHDCLEVSKKILNSSESRYFPSAALFLSVICVSFREIVEETINELLPRLLEIIDTRINPVGKIKIEPKQLSQVALSTCEIVKEYDRRDISSDLSKNAIDMINSKDGFKKINLCGAQMLEIISKSILPEDAVFIFEKVTEYLSQDPPQTELSENEKELDNEIAEVLIHALKKILKKYKRDITFEKADEIMKRLFGQNNGIFGLGSSIETIEDPETNVFTYIKTFITCFKDKQKTLTYIKLLMEYIGIIDSEVLPALLDPIEKAIDIEDTHKKILSDKEVREFLDQIYTMIDVDDSDITTSLLTAITAIVRSYIQVVDIPQLINKLNFLWDNVDETEEDVELPMAIAMLTLELYSKTEQEVDGEKVDIDEQLLIELLAILPLPPDVCDLEHVIQSVMKIAEKSWAKNNSNTLTAIALFMTGICLMKKNEINQYDLSSGTVPDMRKMLKEIAKDHKNIEKEIRSEFSKRSAEVNAILK